MFVLIEIWSINCKQVLELTFLNHKIDFSSDGKNKNDKTNWLLLSSFLMKNTIIFNKWTQKCSIVLLQVPRLHLSRDPGDVGWVEPLGAGGWRLAEAGADPTGQLQNLTGRTLQRVRRQTSPSEPPNRSPRHHLCHLVKVREEYEYFTTTAGGYIFRYYYTYSRDPFLLAKPHILNYSFWDNFELEFS